MKFLITLFFLMGMAQAHNTDLSEDFEVGTPRDCVVLEKTEDQNSSDPQRELQQRITDCLAPDEELEARQETRSQIVSQ